MEVLEEVFNPKKDLMKELLNLKRKKELKFASEIGMSIICIDAKEKQEKIFLLKKEIKSTPELVEFEELEK